MPTYPYACTACGHQFEVVQSFSDAPLTECPVCEGRLRKVFTSVGIVFKGPGFYRTDSRASGNGSSGNGSAGKTATSEGSPPNAGGSGTGAAANGKGQGSGGGAATDSAGSGTGGKATSSPVGSSAG